jgi:YHYH protein
MLIKSKSNFPKFSKNIFNKINFLLLSVTVIISIAGIMTTSNLIQKSPNTENASASPACSVGFFSASDNMCHENVLAPNQCYDFSLPDGANNCFGGTLPLFDCIYNTPGQTEVFSATGGEQKHLCTRVPYFFKYSECTIKNSITTGTTIQNADRLNKVFNYQNAGGYDGIYNSDNMCTDGTNGCYAPGFRPFLMNAEQYHTISSKYKGFLCINKVFADGTYYHSNPIPEFTIFSDTSSSYGSCGNFGNFGDAASNAEASAGAERTHLCSPINGAYPASLKSCASGFSYFEYNNQSYCGRTFAPSGYTCLPGQGLTNINTDSCAICVAGNYCPGGIGNGSTICPINNYCVSGASTPAPCDTGKVSPQGSTSISACTLAVTMPTILNLKAYIAGPFDDNFDLMNNTLRTLNKIPANQPYNDLHFGWQGTETINPNNLQSDIVDWVLVQIRNPYTNAYVTGKAGLLKRDGTIIDPEHSTNGDSATGLSFTGITTLGSYKIVLQHRNHLGISSKTPISINPGGTVSLDFTTNSNVKNNGQITVGTIGTSIVYGLRQADATKDGIVDAQDRNAIGNSNELSNVYDAKDLNNDGVVDAEDRNLVLNSNESQEDIDSTISSTTISSVTISSQPAITSLPLGDGKIGLGTQVGYVKVCSLNFPPVGGAFVDGPWIKNNGTWDPSIKIAVQGNNNLSGRNYVISLNNNTRNISTNDIPDHPVGTFPVGASDPAYNYDRNPNTITPQNIVKTLNANPTIGSNPACLPMGAIGVMTSGVVLFNALDGGGKDAVAHEIQDSCNGHPERQGEYHYHNLSKCIAAGNSNKVTKLVGYAFDGFGIYEEFDNAGNRLKNSDLDICHGRVSNIEWDGQTRSMYHYVATEEYPYTLGCYQGTPQ